MKRMSTVLLLVVVGCSVAADEPTTTTEPPATSTTTIAATTTTAPPIECPLSPYDLTYLPTGVGTATLDPDEIEADVWTSVVGTSTTFWGRSDATVAIALVRGTLPAVDWPGDKGEITIDGTPGVVGPHPDGTWVAGWFEAPGERCDLYSMVFYAPWIPGEVEKVLAGMNRVGG